MFKKLLVLTCLVGLSLTGCATGEKLETYEPLKVPEFAPVEKYEIDLSKLDETNEITLSGLLESQIFVKIGEDGSVNIVFDEAEANGVILYAEDLSKVADLAEIAEGYRNVVLSQAELIEVKNETIRSLQQLVILQQQGKDIYRENFILADKLYKQEHKIRMREKISSDIRFFATVVGIIAVGAI